MKQIFVADDGKEFSNQEDCLDYELKKKHEKEEREKKKREEEEKNRRYDEVLNAYKLYKKLESKYYEDYTPDYETPWNNLLRSLL